MEVDSSSKQPAADEGADGGAPLEAEEPGEATSSSKQPLANERLLFCAEVLIGYKCEVQVSERTGAAQGEELQRVQLLLVGFVWWVVGSGAVAAAVCMCITSS